MGARAALGLFLPGRCASCGDWGHSPLCRRCLGGVRWIDPSSCPRCRRPAPRSDGGETIDHAHAAAVYEGPVRDALKAFKLLGERRTARWLAGGMVEPARALGGDVVTWVPATWASEVARGFNPAEELARPLARSLRLPARRLLAKRRETLDSHGLTREQRRVNLHAAFRARGTVSGHVLLVDDIITSGATAAECSEVLRRAGAAPVSVVTFARTP